MYHFCFTFGIEKVNECVMLNVLFGCWSEELYLVIAGFPVVEALVGMGYSRTEIEDSLAQAKYDDVFATYLLLGRKSTDVSLPTCMWVF